MNLKKSLHFLCCLSIVLGIEWGDAEKGVSIYTRKQWYTVWDPEYCDRIICKYI